MNEILKDYNGIAELIIRPTGLLDPVIDVRPSMPEFFNELKKDLIDKGYDFMECMKEGYLPSLQIPDLLIEIEKRRKNSERVLITTLTKRMSEELSHFLTEKGVKTKYIHSDIDTVERVEILQDLRKGVFDVLVGINLLREGLDLPEVSLVVILDADKEGFLRSDNSLIQTIGRAARNVNGKVLMYADKITGSMQRAIDETLRRRKVQEEYNKMNGITPLTIKKDIDEILERKKEEVEEDGINKNFEKRIQSFKILTKKQQKVFIQELKFQMQFHADLMEFEEATRYRDIIKDLEKYD